MATSTQGTIARDLALVKNLALPGEWSCFISVLLEPNPCEAETRPELGGEAAAVPGGCQPLPGGWWHPPGPGQPAALQWSLGYK